MKIQQASESIFKIILERAANNKKLKMKEDGARKEKERKGKRGGE